MTDREVVSLKEFIEAKLHSQAKLFETKLDAVEKATLLAKESIDQRLAGMNEFRDALKDQTANLVTRGEFDRQTGEINSLKLTRAVLEGKASQGAVYIGYVIAVTGIVLAIISLVK